MDEGRLKVSVSVSVHKSVNEDVSGAKGGLREGLGTPGGLLPNPDDSRTLDSGCA